MHIVHAKFLPDMFTLLGEPQTLPLVHPCLGFDTVLITSYRPFDIPILPSQFQSKYNSMSVVPVHFAYHRAHRPSNRLYTVEPQVLISSPQVLLLTTTNHRCPCPVLSTYLVSTANKYLSHMFKGRECPPLISTRRVRHSTPAGSSPSLRT